MSLARARELRHAATPPERVLWALLGQFREAGYHFRRQVPIGPYYADMACHHAKLVIEADGLSHVDAAYDQQRDAYMAGRGYRVLRFSNRDIAANPEGVFAAIADYLKHVPVAPTPGPSPQGGGEQEGRRPRQRKLRTGLRELAARTGDTPPLHQNGESD
jgi:very-short-patch-repair endonuclease